MKVGLNQEVRIRLTESGRRILQAEHLKVDFKDDGDGWHRVQLWILMAEFGRYLAQGSEPPFETEIEVLPAT